MALDIEGARHRSYNFLYFLVFSLTPEVPRHVWSNFRWSEKREFVIVCLLGALIFTFGLTAAFCLIEGRLFPDPARVKYNFFEDYSNLLLYVVICPAYITLCALLAGEASAYWAERGRPIKGTYDLYDGVQLNLQTTVRPIRFGIALLFILLFAGLSIGNYQYDLVYSDDIDFLYWFVEQKGEARIVNRAGFYYLILNFCLLVFTLIGAMSYWGITIETVVEARREDISKICSEKDIDGLILRYRPFFTAVMYCRLLVFVYILNMIIWRYSPLGVATGANINLSIVMLLLLGILGTVLPARIVEGMISRGRDECLRKGLPEHNLHKLPRIEGWMPTFANILSFFVSWEFIGLVNDDLDFVQRGIELLGTLLNNV